MSVSVYFKNKCGMVTWGWERSPWTLWTGENIRNVYEVYAKKGKDMEIYFPKNVNKSKCKFLLAWHYDSRINMTKGNSRIDLIGKDLYWGRVVQNRTNLIKNRMKYM